MSIGDSLLDHFNEKLIKDRISITKSNYKNDKYIRVYFVLNNSETYDVANIHFKKNSNYEIASVSGAIMQDFTFERCSRKQIEIFDDLKMLFSSAKIEGDPKRKIVLKADESKKSVYSTAKYKIKRGYIDVRCTIFSKEYKTKNTRRGNSLQVFAHSSEFLNWIRNEAYN